MPTKKPTTGSDGEPPNKKQKTEEAEVEEGEELDIGENEEELEVGEEEEEEQQQQINEKSKVQSPENESKEETNQTNEQQSESTSEEPISREESLEKLVKNIYRFIQSTTRTLNAGRSRKDSAIPNDQYRYENFHKQKLLLCKFQNSILNTLGQYIKSHSQDLVDLSDLEKERNLEPPKYHLHRDSLPLNASKKLWIQGVPPNLSREELAAMVAPYSLTETNSGTKEYSFIYLKSVEEACEARKYILENFPVLTVNFAKSENVKRSTNKRKRDHDNRPHDNRPHDNRLHDNRPHYNRGNYNNRGDNRKRNMNSNANRNLYQPQPTNTLPQQSFPGGGLLATQPPVQSVQTTMELLQAISNLQQQQQPTGALLQGLGGLVQQQQQQQQQPQTLQPHPNDTVHVSGIPDSYLDKNQIQSVFGEIGAIKDIRFLKNKSTGSFIRGKCFVQFVNPQDAVKAINMFNGTQLDNHVITITTASKRNTNMNSNRNMNKKVPRYPDCSTIFVGNINYNSSEEDVENFFSRVGNVVEVRLLKKNGQFQGCGFVEFNSPEEATSAVQSLDGTTFGGRTLTVAYSDKPRSSHN